MHFNRNHFSRARAQVKKDFNDFKFGTFLGRFPSDGAGSIAVKGLSFLYIFFYVSLCASASLCASVSLCTSIDHYSIE